MKARISPSGKLFYFYVKAKQAVPPSVLYENIVNSATISVI